MTNVLEYLELAAEHHGDRVAMEDGDRTITYSQLRIAAKKIGVMIKEKGLTKEDKPVGVYASRDIFTPIIYMGILYSGNFYVPLDADMPQEKREKIIAQSGMELILSADDVRELVDGVLSGEIASDVVSEGINLDFLKNSARNAEEKIEKVCCEDRPLYMVYTSGSTGVPKGVLKTHQAMIDYVEAFSKEYPYKEHEIMGNQTPFFFDASAKDIYLMLKHAATMIIIPTSMFSFPVKLVEYLNEKKVTVISWVPSALSILTQLNAFAEIKPVTLERVFFVGEVFPMKQLNKWRKELPHLQYVNLYGSSEIAGICCHYEVKPEEVFEDTQSLPMGKPLANCKILLVSQQDGHIITDNNVSGEIYLSSKALAREYFGDEEKTKNSFMIADLDGTGERRYFKTGDLASYNDKGDLIFASRKDFQIKHMGHRIELGEIEVAANSLDGVVKCGCIYDDVKHRIMLFCQCVEDVELSGNDIKALLAEKLSSYMVPNRVTILEQVPLNANGKIDRMALKEQYLKK